MRPRPRSASAAQTTAGGVSASGVGSAAASARSRPAAVDPLFRSAARAFGPRVIGVILSGARDDGASGLHAIAERGGLIIVQDPEEALHPGMPRAALANGRVDHVVQAAKLGAVIDEAARRTVPEPTPSEDSFLNGEVAVADAMPVTTDTLPGSPAGFGCPTCGGSLWEMQTAPVPRYRCRVGHAWSPESLLDEQANALESSLWMALRALEESRRCPGDWCGRWANGARSRLRAAMSG